MIIILKKWMLPVVFTVTLILNTVSICRSDVVVFDSVTTVQTPIRLRVLTKGRIFSAGGRLVDIYLDDDHLKKILTGGDGYGYLNYTPQRAGFKKITARSNKDWASGLILVMNKSDKAVVIEIEEGFKEALFSDKIMGSSLKAVNFISQNYKIIYLSRYLGKSITGRWLEKQSFPKSVILRWRGPQMLAALREKGVRLHAVIGSAAVITAAAKHIENRYTFEKTKDGKSVKDWDEILKLLRVKTAP